MFAKNVINMILRILFHVKFVNISIILEQSLFLRRLAKIYLLRSVTLADSLPP